MKDTIFITGGSGYVGALLIKHFVYQKDVEKIISLDRKNPPQLLTDLPKEFLDKIVFIKTDMLFNSWEEEVKNYNPTIIIHCAWQIRSLYKKEKEQWLSNVIGSDNVFNFAFKTESVKKLIHFSTVASYGAEYENEMTKFFTEKDSLRYNDFRYAYEKKEAEDRLYAKYCMQKNTNKNLEIFVVRPASITGEYAKSKKGFSLQSVLSGKSKNIFVRLLSKILFFAPLTKKWSRQFVHEEDIVGAIDALVSFKNNTLKNTYEVFNLCPPGDIMKASDMAKVVNKKLLFIHPQIIRATFFLLWHGTFGKIPTSNGGWKSYCYPIVVDGKKITEVCGYEYKYGPQESFVKTLES